MLAKLNTFALVGIDALPVEVQVDVSAGLPKTVLVGLPDTSNRDSGLLEQSNEAEINKRLKPFSEGAAPDLVFEQHSHWAVGYLTGFSIRVYRVDGSITPAFEEFCRIEEALEDYPVLNEQDYSQREYEATLENYACEMWRERKNLPEGWESEVYSWFSDHGHDCYTENADDRGGWGPREKIAEALQALGHIQAEADCPIIVFQKAGANLPESV